MRVAVVEMNTMLLDMFGEWLVDNNWSDQFLVNFNEADRFKEYHSNTRVSDMIPIPLMTMWDRGSCFVDWRMVDQMWQNKVHSRGINKNTLVFRS